MRTPRDILRRTGESVTDKLRQASREALSEGQPRGTPLLGGSGWPVGSVVGFVERPYEEVLNAMLAPGAEEEKFRPVELPLSEIEERLRYLTPLQFPSKRHLVFPAGAEWTAHIRNSGHGDSSAWVWNRSRNLACRGVLATHVPASQYPYPSTQIELFGPTGRPPLGSVRSISAGIYDEGHWRFDQSGKPLPFEELDAYRERLIRDRFTRPMLIRYLSALGIDVDDRATYGREGTLFKSLSAYKPRTVRLSDWRAENGDG